jgi:hypothetical protein
MPDDTACDTIAKGLQVLKYRIHRGSRGMNESAEVMFVVRNGKRGRVVDVGLFSGVSCRVLKCFCGSEVWSSTS